MIHQGDGKILIVEKNVLLTSKSLTHLDCYLVVNLNGHTHIRVWWLTKLLKLKSLLRINDVTIKS